MSEDHWIDEHGTVWIVPTAWAYAQACKARDRWQSKAEIFEGQLGEAEDKVEFLQRRAEWTTSTPKEPGWYWWRFSKTTDPWPIEISSIHGILEVCADSWKWNWTDLAHGEWSNVPLEAPHEARG